MSGTQNDDPNGTAASTLPHAPTASSGECSACYLPWPCEGYLTWKAARDEATRCCCGHGRADHIYDEGACRPGPLPEGPCPCPTYVSLLARPTPRAQLVEDALGMLVASLDTDTGGIDDGSAVHALLVETDGDGWTEPFSLRARCACDEEDASHARFGIEWTQTDRAQTDRPSEVDVALAWRAHVLTALDQKIAITHLDALECDRCRRAVTCTFDFCGPGGAHDGPAEMLCTACHPDHPLPNQDPPGEFCGSAPFLSICGGSL